MGALAPSATHKVPLKAIGERHYTVVLDGE